MSRIEKVMIFDDKECYKDKVEFLQGVNAIMKRSFKECKTLKDFEISPNLKVQFFFMKNDEYYEISEGDTAERQSDWYNNIDNLFVPGEGCLVLCDYQWKRNNQSTNMMIYNAIRNNSNVIFVAYTSVMFPEAQQWIEELLKDTHSCTIMDMLLSIPSDDMSGTFRSLEEAMWDEW